MLSAYIRGCKLKDMKSVLDFLYFGEVSVEQGDVQQFMSLAKDLQIKGFELSDVVENENVSEVKSENSEKATNIRNGKEEQSKKSSPKPIDLTESKEDNLLENDVIGASPSYKDMNEEETENMLFRDNVVETSKSGSEQSSTLVELENKRERLVIKLEENKYQCEKCWNTYSRKDDLKRHTDVHFPEYSYPCKYCGKMYNTRETLRRHARFHKRNNERQMLSYLPEVIFHQE
jgi:hypothetical protein